MVMLARAILVHRFWHFRKVGRQWVNTRFSLVRHGTVIFRRMPDVNHAHGEIQNEHRRCSFDIALEAAPATGQMSASERSLGFMATLYRHCVNNDGQF
jgi:hypothetical protein